MLANKRTILSKQSWKILHRKKAKHEPSTDSLSLICSFNSEENRHKFYRGRDCIEKFCKNLKELATKIINYEEKDMIPLTDNENKFYEEQKECHICQKEFCYDKNEKKKFKIYQKVRDHCHYTGKFRGAAHSICNLRYKVPKEIHNGSTYDYHFIIKQLAEDFKGQFECLGENTEKYITFSVPIEKEVVNGKKDNDSKKEDNDSKKEDEDNNSEKEKDNNSKKENNHVQNKVYWQL